MTDPSRLYWHGQRMAWGQVLTHLDSRCGLQEIRAIAERMVKLAEMRERQAAEGSCPS